MRTTPWGRYISQTIQNIAIVTGGVEKIRDFLPISRYILQTIQNIAIVTMEGE